MDTKRFDKKSLKVIAHRGLSGLECENTCAAFVAAGMRSYFGVETDMHVTRDGKFVIIHDSDTGRVSDINMVVENEDFETVRSIRLRDKDGESRGDLIIPALDEYIRICKKYDKYCVLELKGEYAQEKYEEMIEIINSFDYLDHVIFISFWADNCIAVRKLLPNAKVQFLCNSVDDERLKWLTDNHLDIDIAYKSLTPELCDKLHSSGLEVNCWTVDNPEDGNRMVEMGVDYITTNILE